MIGKGYVRRKATYGLMNMGRSIPATGGDNHSDREGTIFGLAQWLYNGERGGKERAILDDGEVFLEYRDMEHINQLFNNNAFVYVSSETVGGIIWHHFYIPPN